MILTGQAQTAKYDKQGFKTNVVCTHVSFCSIARMASMSMSRATVQFRISGALSISDPMTGGNFVDNTQYSPGGPGDIVVVRLFYQWPLFVTGLGYNIANLSGSKRLLSATAAFKNEPYS